MEHITPILFFFLTVRYLVHLFSFLRAYGGSEPPSARRGTARGAACQCTGTPGQSTPLLPEPADGEEALRKTRCDCLFWCQSQPEQVTFSSAPAPPQLTPFPHRTKIGDPSLAQLPHKSSSSALLCPWISIAQLQRAEYHDPCHVESQKRYVTFHSTLVMLYTYVTNYWLYKMQKIWKSSTFLQNKTAPVKPLKRSHGICLPFIWTWRGNWMFYPRFIVSYINHGWFQSLTFLFLWMQEKDTELLRTSFSVQRCNRNKTQHILTYFRYNGQMWFPYNHLQGILPIFVIPALYNDPEYFPC